MYELHTEIEINAPAERIWAILTDFDAYPSWNPFVRRISGRAELEDQLEVELQPPGSKAMTFKPRVTELEAGRRFVWLGRLVAPKIFDGEHRYELEPLDDGRGVKFIQRERFTGVLVPFLKKNLDTSTRQGFEAMNQALKARAEGAPTSPGDGLQ